jgi:hypothetical protein
MFDLIRFTDDDRAVLKEAARKIDDPYLCGRLDGLAGRVPYNGRDEDIAEDELQAVIARAGEEH